jgi:hypothetical protein
MKYEDHAYIELRLELKGRSPALSDGAAAAAAGTRRLAMFRESFDVRLYIQFLMSLHQVHFCRTVHGSDRVPIGGKIRCH